MTVIANLTVQHVTQIKSRTTEDVNVSVKNTACVKNIIVGMIAHVFVRKKDV